MQRVGLWDCNIRQENFAYTVADFDLLMLKGIWDWMPCTNTIWCLQPKHWSKFTATWKKLFEGAAVYNGWRKEPPKALVFDIIQTRGSGSQLISAINMTAGKAPGAQSREISRCTSVTIQSEKVTSKCRIHFPYNQRTLSGWILHLCVEELRIGWLLLYDYW